MQLRLCLPDWLPRLSRRLWKRRNACVWCQRFSLDFQIAKLIEKDDLEVKLNIKDILALPQIFFYDINDNNKFDSQDKTNLNNPFKNADLPFRERRFGTVISAVPPVP